MKHILVILLIFNLQNEIYAHENADSLLGVWNNKTISDTTRLNALHTILSDVVFLSNNPDSALILAGLMYDMAVENDLKLYTAAAANHKGWCFTWKYENEKALTAFELGLQLSTELDDKLGLANSYLGMGSVYIEKGDYNKSQEYLSTALKLATISGNKEKISQILHFTGSSYFQSGNEPAAFESWERGFTIAKEADYPYEIAMSLFNLGNIHAIQGNYPKALDHYKRADALFQELGDTQILPTIISNMGGIYHFIKNYPKAIEYLLRSIELSKKNNDMAAVAWSTGIIADIYIELEDYDNALAFTDACYKVSKESGNAHGTLIALRAYANISAELGDFKKAIEYANQGLQIADNTNNSLIKSFIYELLGKQIYMPMRQFTNALDYCKQALSLYEKSGALFGQRDACDCIYRAYKGLHQTDKALAFYERFQELDDSLQIEETARKFQEMEYEKIAEIDSLAQIEEKRLVQAAHEEAIRRKEQARNISFVIGGLVLLVAGGMYSRLNFIRKSKARLQQEKDRAENLLLNILPEEIANELKEKGKSMARDFEMVSILFSDFIGFTEASARLSAQDLVTEINACFEAFDGIMDKYGIEKIKTIGDAYMAAGGLPVPTEHSVKNTILAALEMQAFISMRKVELDALDKHAFQMRIGIHTGPVVAGIVGVKKFQYDIWGDTVNTANRMESNGEVGKVNISQATYDLIKGDKTFAFEARGKIEAKGKGEIDMYFVETIAKVAETSA